MHLTPDQEQNLIMEFYDVIKKYAANFCSKYNGGTPIDVDDATQECTVVFLNHIRSVDSADQIRPLPFRDMQHALCLHALGRLPVSVPRRTSNFTGVIKQVPTAGSLESMIEEGLDVSAGLAGGYTEVEEKASFDLFFHELSDEDRALIRCMANANSISEAGKALGVHKSTLSRRLAALKAKYLKDCKKIGGNVA